MKCGLYDESYKIAADTNLLVNYLYNCHLKVAYLHVDEADENGMVRKPTRPSLPLRKAPLLSPSLSLARRERM